LINLSSSFGQRGIEDFLTEQKMVKTFSSRREVDQNFPLKKLCLAERSQSKIQNPKSKIE
jgi:hypothetical protein